MSVITDSIGSWEQLGEATVTDQWLVFPAPTESQLFRITTTIEDVAGWNEGKIKSGSFLRFYYPDGSTSPRIYQRVIDKPLIRELPPPGKIKVNRQVGCVLSSRWLRVGVPLSRFARWKLKLEALI